MNATQTLPEELFLNPVLGALRTAHAHFALRRGQALRYRPDVSPFAALASSTTSALRDLHSLLSPGEKLWLPDLLTANLAAAGLTLHATLPCHQMILPDSIPLPGAEPRILTLTSAEAPEMVALTDVAFPGFFRSRTCDMGRYYGIRSETVERQLIAMGGERLTFPGYSEISGLCTHPAHRGRGFAASLIWEIVRYHRRERIASWLHVSASNTSAIALYHALGFKTVRTIPLYQVSRR